MKKKIGCRVIYCIIIYISNSLIPSWNYYCAKTIFSASFPCLFFFRFLSHQEVFIFPAEFLSNFGDPTQDVNTTLKRPTTHARNAYRDRYAARETYNRHAIIKTNFSPRANKAYSSTLSCAFSTDLCPCECRDHQ